MNPSDRASVTRAEDTKDGAPRIDDARPAVRRRLAYEVRGVGAASEPALLMLGSPMGPP
jgi:hypothetical protein